MKKLIMALIALFAIQQTTFAGEDTPVTVSQLPQKAQQFIQKYYNVSDVSYAKMDKDWFETSYDVVFDNGTELEFNKDGEWIKVEQKHAPLPKGIVPAAIQEYVKTYYPKAKIMEIKREHREYEVELNNGIELTFSKDFKLIKVDD